MARVKTGQLILAAIFAIFVYGMVAPMLGTLLPTFQLQPRQDGILTLTNALGLVIASLAVGPIIDNKGKKVGLVSGLGLIAIALFLIPNSGGDFNLIATFMLLL